MLRLIWVVFLNLFRCVYYLPKMTYYGRHPEKYSDEDCYALAQRIISIVKKSSRIETEYLGVDNLPKGDEGYILFSNHQGKYDAPGILGGHKRPCSVLMDKRRSKLPIADQFIELLRAQRIDKNSLRQQISVLKSIANEVSEGRVYLVFPEGGYEKDQGNRVGEFKHGCFLCATRAKAPIVPVAIIDSYIPFRYNSLKRVKTKVVYLPPLTYEDYKGMSTNEISDTVKALIEAEIAKHI